jgi:hypothetical protein
MSKSSNLVNVANAAFIKPAVAGLIAAIGEKYVMHSNDVTSLYFGGAVAAGVLVSGTIGAIVEPYMPTSTSISSTLGKTLEARIIEVSSGSAVAYAVNKFVLNNEWRTDTNSILMRIGIITAADVIGEVIVDAMSTAKL